MERFTYSVPFKLGGRWFVQVGDANQCCVCLVDLPTSNSAGVSYPDYLKIKFVVDALNLKDASEKIAPMAARRLGNE